MSITSSKISVGTQFKAHIGANHAARHLRLKKLGNKQKKRKVVQSVLPGTVLAIISVTKSEFEFSMIPPG